MNTFPTELRTPPLPVIAFIGCQELHKDVGSYFNRTIRPPFFSVGLAEPTESLLVRLFGKKRQPKPFSTPDGILKADWFTKQRQRRAAVAIALVPRSHVEGDPSSWMRMLSGLKAIRAASSHQGVALLLVVVQDGPVTELPPDRAAGLRNNLELDPRHLCLISRQSFDPALTPEERKQLQDTELGPLGLLVTEAAAAYYTAAATRLRQRQLDIAAALGSAPPEINAAIAFKLAVLAEFRQDWLGAVSSYQAAAAALQGVPLGRPTVSCQRHAEVTAVAEIVQFKAMMLLLHQQRYPEAIRQLRGHLGAFGLLPDDLPVAAASAHYGWLVRQYLCAAEMIGISRMDEATLQAHKDVTPAYLYMSAAQLAARRKAAAEQLSNLRDSAPTPFDASAVRKGRYLGQIEFKRPEGAAGHSDMSDAEFCLYLECEERKLSHSQLVLDALLQAQTSLTKHISRPLDKTAPPAAAAGPRGGRGASDRLQARLAWLMAEQQIDTNNLTAARKLLLQAVHTYRRDGWDSLLLCTLLQLRDVCQRLKLHKEALLHSLELSCLVADSMAAGTPAQSASRVEDPTSGYTAAVQHGIADYEQAIELASAALAALMKGPVDKKVGIMKAGGSSSSPISSPKLADASAAAAGSPSAATAAGSPSAATAAGRPGSPLTGSSSNSNMSWSYVVQQVDLAAVAVALQQLPSKEDPAKSTAVTDLLLQFNQPEFGWWRILTVAGGFVIHPPDPTHLQVCIAVYNHLPVPLPLLGAAVTLADSQGSWVLPTTVGPGRSSQQDAVQAAAALQADTVADSLRDLQVDDQRQSANADSQAAAGWPLALQPGSWLLLHVRFPPRCVGSVGVGQLHLQLSEHCSVNFVVSSFPPGRPALGRATLPGAEGPFSVQQGVKLGTWGAKVQHVGALPTLQVLLPELLLVGEFVPTEVVISASTPQAPSTLDLSLRTAMGATPGQATILAVQPDGKLHALNPEAHTLQIPALPAGGTFTQRVWIRSQVPNSLKLVAVLNCPAAVTQTGELQFVEPFEHVTRLTGEMGLHTLVAASQAYTAANGVAAATAAAGSGVDEGVPVMVGQVLFAQVLVRCPHDVGLMLQGAELQLQQDSGLQLLNKLSDQLAGQPLCVSPGSVQCLLLQLVPINCTKGPVSMGSLRLRWKRKHSATALASRSRGINDVGVTALAVGAAPAEEVTTSMELPQVLVQESLLSVKVVAPERVTAGIAFPFTLQVVNSTSKPQELLVSVQEAQGFVFSGDKQQVVTVLPTANQHIKWTLVAHASGQLPLPAVRVASARFSCHVVTQSLHVHVLPF